MYGRDFITPIDHNQMWSAMLSPGSQGWGLHCSIVSRDLGCAAKNSILPSDSHVLYDENGFVWTGMEADLRQVPCSPLLAPVSVYWESITGSDGDMPHEWLHSHWDLDPFPMVGIKTVETFPPHQYRFGYERELALWKRANSVPHANPEGSINSDYLAIVPIWTVLPTSKEYGVLMDGACAQHLFTAMSIPLCCGEHMGMENCSDPAWKEEVQKEIEANELDSEQAEEFLEMRRIEHFECCSACEEIDTAIVANTDSIEDLYEVDLSQGDFWSGRIAYEWPNDGRLPEMLQGWQYLLDRSSTGWNELLQVAEGGDAWASSLWRQLSPLYQRWSRSDRRSA